MNVGAGLFRHRLSFIVRSRLRQLGRFRQLVRSRGLGLLCLSLALLALACASESGPTDPAPDFTLTLYGTETRQAGETLRLSELKGKPVVLNFWFPSCPPCVAEMPDIERTFQNHRSYDVEFIGIQLVGIDTAEDGQNFVNDMGVTYALGPDEDDIIMKYKVNGFPMTVFIDKEQNIVRKWQGVLNEEKMVEILGEILH